LSLSPHRGEAGQDLFDLRMVRTIQLATHLQGLAEERLGLGQTHLCPTQNSQDTKVLGQQSMLRPPKLPADFDGQTVAGFSLPDSTARQMDGGHLAKG
jgi:hypothetical protein